MKKKSVTYIYIVFIAAFFVSCSKEWLDVQSNRSKFVPETLEDLEALLNNERYLNTQSGFTEEGSTDNYYISDDVYDIIGEQDRNMYTWQADIFNGGTSIDWKTRYQRIFVCNVVIHGLDKLGAEDKSTEKWKTLYGEALFFRSTAFYYLAQGFAKQYSPGTAAADAGIPLRIDEGIDEKISRATVQQTYEQIINDIRLSRMYLSEHALVPTKPDQQAAHGFLARVFLSMEKYDDAFIEADSCLKMGGDLLNFNLLNAGNSYPVPKFNTEVIFADHAYEPTWFYNNRALVDTILYASYSSADLRKSIFFSELSVNRIGFRGSFSGSTEPFTGLTTGEMYLIRSECNARKNNVPAALEDLDQLLVNRYSTGNFIPSAATDVHSALDIILQQRRKELIFRNLRWSDLRRLNKDDQFKTTLARNVHGTFYTLEPGSARYVLPIPPDVLQFNDLTQNER